MFCEFRFLHFDLWLLLHMLTFLHDKEEDSIAPADDVDENEAIKMSDGKNNVE